MSTRGTFRLATRGSDLALRQAQGVKATLEERRYEVDLIVVETDGDQLRDELITRLGTTGAFVRSLDEKVLEGAVDGAVHSMKDMPTDQPGGLVVAGIPERGPPGDVLVTPDGTSFDALPSGAIVGTSSVRRQAQVTTHRPDLSVEGLRGNVDTRVEKLLAPHRQREHQAHLEAEEGNADGDERSAEEWFDGLLEIERRALERQVDTTYDAIVLAAAGLERLGLRKQLHAQDLPLSSFVPAPGQGALAVTARAGSKASDVFYDVLDHPRTRVETTVERAMLAELGAGCIAPIGIYAVIQGRHVHVTAQVIDPAGEEHIGGTRDLPVERYLGPARAFASDLAGRGAAELIDEIREAEDE